MGPDARGRVLALLLCCTLRIGHLPAAAAHKASLWVTPAEGTVPVGQQVSLRCLCQVPCARLFLYRGASPVPVRHAEAKGQAAEFPISRASPGDAGSYRCRYLSRGWQPRWSEHSDPVQLVVRGTNPASSPTRPPESPSPTSTAFPGPTSTAFPGPTSTAFPGPTSTAFPSPTSTAFPGHSHSPSSAAPTSPALPDFTHCNLIRLGLGTGVLLALGLILAEFCHSRARGCPSIK